MARTPIYAAGGIVMRGGKHPRIAVVQRSKDERWVLPRGKLKRKEDPRSGARREVVEETGHRVRVHEFLGAITYRAGGRPKVVQFWRMVAYERPSRDVMSDIVAVEWLPLPAAVRRLSFPLEKLFLQHAGKRTQKRAHKHRKAAKRAAKRAARRGAKRARRKAAMQARHKTSARGKSVLHSRKVRRPKPHATRARRAAAPSRVRAARRRGMLQRMLGRLSR